jgi:hypothetical protein
LLMAALVSSAALWPAVEVTLSATWPSLFSIDAIVESSGLVACYTRTDMLPN